MLILAPILHVCVSDQAGLPGGCPASGDATQFDDFTIATVLEVLDAARNSEDTPHIANAIERFSDFLRESVKQERVLDGMSKTMRAFTAMHRPEPLNDSEESTDK